MKTVFIASLLMVASAVIFAQSRQATDWGSSKCKTDPFNEKGFIDCFMFVVEEASGSLSLETRSLAAVRMSRSSAGREHTILQFTSQKSPPLLNGNHGVKNLLLRVDQGEIMTFTPQDIFMDLKSNGAVFQNIAVDEKLAKELFKGGTMYVRYTAQSGDEVTQQYSLKTFIEIFTKMAAEYEEIASTNKPR